METTYNYLNNKVIPAIDIAINKLNHQITLLEEEQQELDEQSKGVII